MKPTYPITLRDDEQRILDERALDEHDGHAAPHAGPWTTRGNVRGECPHRHRTLRGAARCLARDRAGCASQGGYSDRMVVEVRS